MTIYMPDGRPAPLLLTEDEAVQLLRIDSCNVKNTSATLARYRAGGTLRGVQISRRILYPIAEIERFIEEQVERNPR